ncbi:MAG: hypothetical protein KDD51_14000, partial [Bdellovibrionales bacterium]|nr:hypothetical protein [Bdellovibrionales bacterium]
PLITENSKGPLRILKHPATDQWANRVYSAYFLGGFYPVEFLELTAVPTCTRRNVLVAPKALKGEQAHQLNEKGWHSQWVQAGQLRLYTCE